MDFVSIRIITADVARLVAFYEEATGAEATWATEDFAELYCSSGEGEGASGATLAIASTRTVALFAPDAARAAANRSVIIEFLVADVDAVHRALADSAPDVVTPPTTMPWGNRSLLVRDPDGNLVNFFTPVTPQAIAKFSARLSPAAVGSADSAAVSPGPR